MWAVLGSCTLSKNQATVYWSLNYFTWSIFFKLISSHGDFFPTNLYFLIKICYIIWFLLEQCFQSASFHMIVILSVSLASMLTSAFSILLWPWSVLNGKESNWDDFCCILWLYHMQENLQCDLKIWRVSSL